MNGENNNSKPNGASKGGVFDLVGRPVYIQVDLDSLSHNLKLHFECMKDHPKTEVMGVVKADSTGHGATAIAKHLKTEGVNRLALATILEGIQLRLAGVKGPIHVFGNHKSWEMHRCLKYNLTPAVADEDGIRGMAEAMVAYPDYGMTNEPDCPEKDKYLPRGSVEIKVDTGMNRNGCQPGELDHLVKICKEVGVPLDGIFSHFANYEDPEFTKKQLDIYREAIAPHRDSGVKLHIAHAGGCLYGYGTEYNYVRPGITLYGLPPGNDVVGFAAMGFRPILSIKAMSTLDKLCPKGSKIGYGCTYTCPADEWIASLPIGFADGYWRHLANKGIVRRDKTGEKCQVVGKVSMDAISVRVPEKLDEGEIFTIYTPDFDPDTSVSGVSKQIDTNPQEICNRLPPRTPRVYLKGGVIHEIIHGLRLSDDIVNC